MDHDLQERRASETDQFLSGGDVTAAIIQYISREVPILIHSVNASQSTVMTRRLKKAGFDATQIPMSILTKETFECWLEEVKRNWLDAER